jgi:quercetin dioxygenase-like cupin family protein/ketosteroid isomerase-like protein
VSEENVQLVQERLSAFLGGDVERALADLDPDAITYRAPPLPDPQAYRGPEGVLQAFADWTADFGEFEMSTGEFIDAGDRVVVEIFQRGTGQASGADVEGRFWFVYTIADGRIVRQDFFNAKRQAFEAAGLDGEPAVAIVVPPGDGETITALERRDVALLADREEISVTWSRYAPGEVGPDPHVHREHTDAWYVLDGELTFRLGPEAERVRAAAGSFVAVPPNLVHSFANEGAEAARFLNFHTPDGGFAAYMRGRRDGLDTGFDSHDPPADGGLGAGEAVISGPGEGERLVSGNRTLLLKGPLVDLCFAEFTIEGQFDGPGLHRHDAEVDSFYVLEGELELTVEDSIRPAVPGTLAAVPRGVRHAFAHRVSGGVRFLNVHAPDAGFAAFLRRVSD